MKATKEILELCKVKLEIEFEQGESQKVYGAVIRKIAKDASVPGFPKGKVPRSIIEDRVGKESIQAQSVEQILNDNLVKILEEQDIELYEQARIIDTNNDFENGLKVTLEATIIPAVELNNYKELTMELPVINFEDYGITIEHRLEQLAKQHGESKEITDNSEKAEIGDLVKVTINEDVNGQATEVNEEEIVLNPEEIEDYIIEAIKNLAVGEKTEISKDFPVDYNNEEYAGKTAKCSVELHKLTKKVACVIDEELAKKCGKESLEELNKATEADLEKSKKFFVEERKKKLYLDHLLKNCKIEIPGWMIDREYQNIMDDLNAVMPTEVKDQVENKLKAELILSKIAKEEKIELTQQELMSTMYYFQNVLRSFGRNEQITPALINSIKKSALTEKVIHDQKEKITFNEKPETKDDQKMFDELDKKFRYYIGYTSNPKSVK